MKYYHVIYNSSEKGIEGGRGFCFRTYTKGTPISYLTALQENDLLNYSQGEFQQLMPATLKNEPEKIKDYPTSYFFRRLAVDGKSIYVLGRTIPVGFDYNFYIKFVPGRMGNYVTDCYMFEENPGADVLQILYENPAPLSNRFIPTDPTPNEGNEEMKSLSLGQMEALPLEDKPFNADSLSTVSDNAIKALFSLIEAKKNNKVLVVKTNWKEAAGVIADLYRLLPKDIVGDFSFVSNYQEDGVPKDVQILFINEYYSYTFSDNMAVKCNPNEGWTETPEYETFGEALKKDLDNNNIKSVHDRVKWLLSDTYYKVKDKSKETNAAFYQYCIVPEEFSLAIIDKNEEFTALLAEHVKKIEKNKEPFMTLVSNKVKEISSSKDAVNVVNYLEWLKKKGFDVAIIGEQNKTHITELISASAADFSSAISITDGKLPIISQYFDKSVLEKKNSFLDDDALKSKWIELYKFFYKVEDLSGNNRKKVLERVVANGLNESDILTVLNTLYEESESSSVASLLKEEISANPDKVDVYWPLLVNYMEKHGQNKMSVDFVDVYKKHLSAKNFAPIFFYQYKINGLSESPEKALAVLKSVAETNLALKSLFESEFDSAIYNKLFLEVKDVIKNDDKRSLDFAKSIKTNVLDFFSKQITGEWSLLYNFLTSAEDVVNSKNILEYLSLAECVESETLFKGLQEQFISIALKSSDSNVTKKIVELLIKLVTNDTEDLLAIFSDKKKQSKARNFFIEILKQNKVDIKSAEKLIADKKIPVDSDDEFLIDVYEDQYKSYKRKNFIKNLLKRPFFWVAVVLLIGIFVAAVYFLFFEKKSLDTPGKAGSSDTTNIKIKESEQIDSLNSVVPLENDSADTLQRDSSKTTVFK
ncbi:MAG: hypothetical protein E7077_08930 [Bacteroidales bacterium]|jgi:hypothetical protein|nr:hypothetical protein [Bacteroidales bacterium]